MKACQDAHNADKTVRFAEAAKEREVEENRIKMRTKLKEEVQAEKEKQARLDAAEAEEDLLAGFLSEVVPPPAPISAAEEAAFTAEEDNLLAGFFNEVTQPVVKAQSVNSEAADPEAKPELTEKYSNQDLGDGRKQVDRILAKHFEWRNLNPFAVLQLGVDATEEDIKLRYKKLSLRVHPDRLRDVPTAREAFEQVNYLVVNISCSLRL